MPSSGLLTLYHPALDAGSSPVWIPVFTGMTHPLSSSTESEALRIGDPAPPVIPHLMRDPVLPEFPFSREWHIPCHPQPKAKRFGLGIQPLPSSRTWCGIHSDWIPVFTGMTEGRCGIQTKRLDSRFHENDKKNAGMPPSRHPQPKAKRFGLGIQLVDFSWFTFGNAGKKRRCADQFSGAWFLLGIFYTSPLLWHKQTHGQDNRPLIHRDDGNRSWRCRHTWWL